MALLQPVQPQSTLGTQATPATGQPATQPPQDLPPTATTQQQQAPPLLPPAGSILEVTLSTFAHLGATGTSTASTAPPTPLAGIAPPTPQAGIRQPRGRSRSSGRGESWADADHNAPPHAPRGPRLAGELISSFDCQLCHASSTWDQRWFFLGRVHGSQPPSNHKAQLPFITVVNMEQHQQTVAS